MQWNSRSVISNKGLLEKYIFDNKLNAVLLSETWLKKKNNINFTGFNIFRCDRDDGYGGVAILLRNNFTYVQTPNFYNINNLMCISISVKICKSLKVNIYSIYAKPNLKISTREWVRFFDSLEKPFIVGGDFNCHHTGWGCSVTDTAGTELLSAIEDCQLNYLNDGSETLIPNPNHKNKSSIDLTICSTDLTTMCEWRTDMISLGSNHFPILVELNTGQENAINLSYPNKLNLKKADWIQFSQLVDNHITNSTEELAYESFIQIINDTARLSIPERKNISNPKFCKSWWNAECDSAIKKKKEAFSLYKQNSNITNYINFNKAAAIVKKTILKSKRASWHLFCTNLNRSTPIKKVWEEVKKLKNIYRIPQMKLSNDDWVLQFLIKVAPPWANTQIEENEPLPFHPLLRKFTPLELENSLKIKKKQCTGER